MKHIKQYENILSDYKKYIITKYKYDSVEYIHLHKLNNDTYLNNERKVILQTTLIKSYLNNIIKDQHDCSSIIYIEDIIYQTDNYDEAETEFNNVNNIELTANKYNL